MTHCIQEDLQCHGCTINYCKRLFEFYCSNHLYHNHPDHSVGKLTHDRQLLVKNKHLCELAEKLRLSDFMLRNLKAEFTEESTLHFLSNSVEAILGAVFLDGGLEDTDRVFARLAFPEKVQTLVFVR